MTNNHDYNTPAEGTSDWHVPINQNFEQIDKDVEIRDKDTNKGSYEPKDGAKFFATDSGNVYLGDGSSWNAVSTGTSDDNPSFNSVNTQETYNNAQAVDVAVYQNNGTTRAIGKNGVIDKGSNPSAVIQSAIQSGRYIEITGDYDLTEEITVTQQNRVIDASAATFSTSQDIKLWHFDSADWNRITTGVLDLTDSGRVALDLHSSMGNYVDVKLRGIPGGTFTEDDGIVSGTYNRTGVRLKGRGGSNSRGTYWNKLRVTNPYGLGGNKGGVGMTFRTSDGVDGGGANANFIHAAKLTDYDIGVNMVNGTGNTFINLEVTGSNIGYRQRPGKFGSQNELIGKAWLEHTNTALDVVDSDLQIVGHVSYAGSDTWATNWSNIAWHDYYRGEYHFADSMLVDHKEGSSGSDPSSQSPEGWLKIENKDGNTRYLPYYA